jgi:NAD(P)-dependent dehydrogenase (short-subunit alcohol dehydrogenase family)
MKDFKDKVAVITGAASGIGRAIAERAGREGMKLVLADIEESALTETTKQLKGEGRSAIAVVTDVSKAEDVEALARRALSEFGGVHFVCNNAGVALVPKPLWEMSLSDWKWCLGVNLWGVIHGVHTFVPIMLKQGTDGHILNVASVAGLLSLPYVGIYHCSKHAVVTMTESLHHELQLAGAKVKASVLCPGWVRTRIMDCYRNRPAELGGPEAVNDPKRLNDMWKAYGEACEAGLPPDFVADLVFLAIWNERLYVLTAPEFGEMVSQRAANIVGQKTPVLDPSLLTMLGIASAVEEQVSA